MQYINKLNFSSVPGYIKRFEAKRKRYYNWARSDYRWLFMFFLSRFKFIRNFSAYFSGQSEQILGSEPEISCLESIESDKIIGFLKNDGLYSGINLSSQLVARIHDYIDTVECYGNRKSQFSFINKDKEIAEQKYNQTFVISKYPHVSRDCPEVKHLEKDPKLLEIAGKYLNAKPLHLSTKLWWSYATEVSISDRLNCAQVFFHYDLIDYRSIQFFFYLTDVGISDGTHVCVLGSHQKKKLTHQLSLFTGHSDRDIVDYYGADSLKFVCGKAGLGFAEDPYCFHKGIPPTDKDRLMLKIVFGANHYHIGSHGSHTKAA